MTHLCSIVRTYRWWPWQGFQGKQTSWILEQVGLGSQRLLVRASRWTEMPPISQSVLVLRLTGSEWPHVREALGCSSLSLSRGLRLPWSESRAWRSCQKRPGASFVSSSHCSPSADALLVLVLAISAVCCLLVLMLSCGEAGFAIQLFGVADDALNYICSIRG